MNGWPNPYPLLCADWYIEAMYLDLKAMGIENPDRATLDAEASRILGMPCVLLTWDEWQNQ